MTSSTSLPQGIAVTLAGLVAVSSSGALVNPLPDSSIYSHYGEASGSHGFLGSTASLWSEFSSQVTDGTQDEPVADTSLAVRDLHEMSGLTWEQIARLFGVSRRAVHAWANGSRMSASNLETLEELRTLVETVPASNVEERRTLLLLGRGDAPSPLYAFLQRTASSSSDLQADPREL